MSDLIDIAIAAHGGWERWEKLNAIGAHLSVGGAIWPIKGFEGAYADIHCIVDAKVPLTRFTPFLKDGQTAVYRPQETAILLDGAVIEARQDPRAAFAGHGLMTPWDAQNLIYFTGYAMWTYLTTPFLFRHPGVQAEEIEPWEEDGEIYRRLAVTFPAEVPSHSTKQTFYFDATGLLRRHDYSVEIMGGTASANCASDYKAYGGFNFPTKRRVHRIGPDNRPDRSRTSVAIDILDLSLA